MGYAEKMRRNRRSKMKVGGHEIVYLRPTDLDIQMRPSTDDPTRDHVEYFSGFVVDWDFKEIDLIPGGNSEPVEFCSEDFIEWISDRAILWPDLSNTIRDSYFTEQERRSKEAKN